MQQQDRLAFANIIISDLYTAILKHCHDGLPSK